MFFSRLNRRIRLKIRHGKKKIFLRSLRPSLKKLVFVKNFEFQINTCPYLWPITLYLSPDGLSPITYHLSVSLCVRLFINDERGHVRFIRWLNKVKIGSIKEINRHNWRPVSDDECPRYHFSLFLSMALLETFFSVLSTLYFVLLHFRVLFFLSIYMHV